MQPVPVVVPERLCHDGLGLLVVGEVVRPDVLALGGSVERLDVAVLLGGTGPDELEADAQDGGGRRSAPQLRVPAYDAIRVPGLSIPDAGSADAEAVRDALPATGFSYAGTMGRVGLNLAGDLDVSDYELWYVSGDSRDRHGYHAASPDGVVVRAPAGQPGASHHRLLFAVYPQTG